MELLADACKVLSVLGLIAIFEGPGKFRKLALLQLGQSHSVEKNIGPNGIRESRQPIFLGRRFWRRAPLR